jgi:fluoride exporter
MSAILAVAAGAAVGAALRYLLAHAMAHGRRPTGWLPVATLIANTVGCFALGWAVDALSGTALLLVGTGFCGGLTTWSTLATETDRLVATGERRRSATYLVLTLLLGGAAVIAGSQLAQALGCCASPA